MDKRTSCGCAIHPYVDSAGTVWLSELQIEDGTTATSFVNETSAYKVMRCTYATTYSQLYTPVRSGYTFDGWYTAQNGGTKITSSSSVLPYGIALFAHWTANHTHSYTSKIYIHILMSPRSQRRLPVPRTEL